MYVIYTVSKKPGSCYIF